MNINIEPSVAVVVAKRRHSRRVDHGESSSGGLFPEGAVATVYIEQIGCAKSADVKIQTPIIVYIGKNSTLTPRSVFSGRRSNDSQPRFLGHILKFPIAEITEKPRLAALAHHEKVRPSVAVVVSNCHASSHLTIGKLLVAFSPHFRIVVTIVGHDARNSRRHYGEQR